MSRKQEKPVQFILPIGGGAVNQCYYVSEDDLVEKDQNIRTDMLLEKVTTGKLSSRSLIRHRITLLREALLRDRAELLPVLMPQKRMDIARFAELFSLAEEYQSPDSVAWLLEYRRKHYTPEELKNYEERKLDLALGFADLSDADLRRLFRLRYVRGGVCICGIRTVQRAYLIPDTIGGKPVVGVEASAFYSSDPMPRVSRIFANEEYYASDIDRPEREIIQIGRGMENRGSKETALSWRVIRRETGRELLLCERAVAVLPYHPELQEVTWENCAIRCWLNKVFLPLSFTEEERARILSSAVDTPDNTSFGSSGGAPTEDRLFLLSVEEASTLLQDDEARSLRLWWWLRTPGFDNSFAATVTPDGAVVRIGSFVDTDDYAVRPAMWIQTDS